MWMSMDLKLRYIIYIILIIYNIYMYVLLCSWLAKLFKSGYINDFDQI